MFIRNPYILSNLPFDELTNDVSLCLARFLREIERLRRHYDKLIAEGKAPEDYTAKIADRLLLYQDLYEFTNQLVGNVTLFDNMHVLKAMEDTKAIAGNAPNYGFSIYFNHTKPPLVIINKPYA